ncbi:unnamed protein product [Mucor hiemalis]
MLEVIHNSHNNNNNYSNSNHGDNMIIYSLPETLLNKPQPPTPAAAAAASNSITQKQDMASDDLFYRLQKENALLPPQDSTAFILAQIERQNALLEKDPKSIYIQSNELKAHFSTMQRLVQENNNDEEEEEEIDWGFWEAVIEDSDQVALKLPHLLSIKLRSGIPSRVRGLMWQAMSKSASLHLETVYEQLCKEKSPHERIIQRDLARTFPRIDMFKQENGQGQSSMRRILEAYSLYDTDVGYCQGLAFLVGPLLMNMPEAQSFCVFVRLMETYELRSMFTLNMEGLQLRLYQFSCLLTEILPNISNHLSESGVHAAMYASQWFLTLFAYVFPINLVTRIYDIVFAEGAAETIMRVAIAMLKRSQETILEFHEFEDILDFVTTKKLCEPYKENYSHIIRDAMALSDIITRDKMDYLASEYELGGQPLVATGKFGFWRRKRTTVHSKKPDIKRSASSSGHCSTISTNAASPAAVPPASLKKRWSSVSSRRDWSYSQSDLNDADALPTIKSFTFAEFEELKQKHQQTVNELLEVKYDKQDLESERDALKLTIAELERRRLRQRSYSIDGKKPPAPLPFTLKRSATSNTKPTTFHCEENTTSTAATTIVLEGIRSFSDLAIGKDDDSSIAISRQNSIHHSMLSSSSQSYTTTEFDDDDDQISLALTSTTVPVYGDDDEISSQVVHLKVRNFELEQQVEHLNNDIETMTLKFGLINEGQTELVDQLLAMKGAEEKSVAMAKKKDEELEKVNSENIVLKEQLDQMKQLLSSCRMENSALNHYLKDLKGSHQRQLKQMALNNEVESTSIPRPRIRRHSTTSSCIMTVVENSQIHELEQSLLIAKIRLAECEEGSPSHSQQHQENNTGIKKKSSIYGRVLHAIKYNNNA